MESVAISSLSPSSPLRSNAAFKAVVTLLWPYSSSTAQCALLLADPDARQRHRKGQVRVRFTGASARAIATSHIGIGDDVEVALAGAQWITEAESAMVKTPGKSVDGELLFDRRLRMSIKRGNEKQNTIDVDEKSAPASPKANNMLPPSTPAARPSTRPSNSLDAYGVAVYSSPAFMKRLRLSEGSSPYTPVSEDDDLDASFSRKRRRVSYKNVVEWKFDAREPSPEKDQPTPVDGAIEQDLLDAPQREEVQPVNIAEPADTQDEAMEDIAGTVEASTAPAAADDPMAAVDKTEVDPTELTDKVKEAVPEEKETSLQQDEALDGAATNHHPSEVDETEHQPPEDQQESPSTSDMPPPSLPQLVIPPVSLQDLQQTPSVQDSDRPTTPVLLPVPSENLPLPSPFPTSANQTPQSSTSDLLQAVATDAVQSLQEDLQQPTVEDALPEDAVEKSEESVQPHETQQEQSHLPGTEVVAEHESTLAAGEEHGSSGHVTEVKSSEDLLRPASEIEPADAALALEAVNRSLDSRVMHAAQDSTAQSLSGRGLDSETRGEDENLDDEDSEAAMSDTHYNEEEIAQLQESDQEENADEPDWDMLADQLKDEIDEQALEPESDEADDDEMNGRIMYDTEPESDESLEERSDDVSEEEDDSEYDSASPDMEHAQWPNQTAESSEESESEGYESQPPYRYPFGLDGSLFSKESEQESTSDLPESSQDSGEEESTGEDTEAWADRDAAVRAMYQNQQTDVAAEEEMDMAANPPPPSSRSKLTVIELSSESDGEKGDSSTRAKKEPQEPGTTVEEMEQDSANDEKQNLLVDPQPVGEEATNEIPIEASVSLPQESEKMVDETEQPSANDEASELAIDPELLADQPANAVPLTTPAPLVGDGNVQNEINNSSPTRLDETMSGEEELSKSPSTSAGSTSADDEPSSDQLSPTRVEEVRSVSEGQMQSPSAFEADTDKRALQQQGPTSESLMEEMPEQSLSLIEPEVLNAERSEQLTQQDIQMPVDETIHEKQALNIHPSERDVEAIEEPVTKEADETSHDITEQKHVPSSVADAGEDEEEEAIVPEAFLVEDFLEIAPEEISEEVDVKTSVEVGPDTLDPARPVALQTKASVPAPDSDLAQQLTEESRPLTSSSFETLSSSPYPSLQPSQLQNSQFIEEIDLSQTESDPWPVFIRKSLRPSRFEGVADSVDGSVTELVPGSSRASSRRVSPAPQTGPTQNMHGPAMPSQEVGTAFSQLNRYANNFDDISRTSALQLQAFVEEEEHRSSAVAEPLVGNLVKESQNQEQQAALDDELLADFLNESAQLETYKKPENDAVPGQESSPQHKLRVTAGDVVMQDAPLLEQTTPALGESEVHTPPKISSVEQATAQNQREHSSAAPQPIQVEKQPSTVEEIPSAQVIQPQAEGPEPEASKPVTEAVTPHRNGTTGEITRRRSEGVRPSWRKSITSRMSEVPAVINAWFTPRRSSVVVKSAVDNEIESTPTKVSAKSAGNTAEGMSIDPSAKKADQTASRSLKSPFEPAVRALTSPTKVLQQRSISPPPLSRFASQGTSTSLSYFTPLAALPENLNQSSNVDIMAISTSASKNPERAKSGQRDFYTILYILDPSLYEYNIASQNSETASKRKDIRVEIFRPWKASLPITQPGDVILLRDFAVKSRNHGIYLLSTGSSAWCVWRHSVEAKSDEEEEASKPVWARKRAGSIKEEIHGPPVEIGDGEREKVKEIRSWWEDIRGTNQEENAQENGMREVSEDVSGKEVSVNAAQALDADRDIDMSDAGSEEEDDETAEAALSP